jgi:hypothetical protein
MRDDARREFEKRIRDLPNRRIEAEMEEWAYDSEEQSILRRELEEQGRAKGTTPSRLEASAPVCGSGFAPRRCSVVGRGVVSVASLATTCCACKSASSDFASADTTRVVSSHLASGNTRRVSATTRRGSATTRRAASHFASANTREEP